MRLTTICMFALAGFVAAAPGALQDDGEMFKRAKSNMANPKSGTSRGTGLKSGGPGTGTSGKGAQKASGTTGGSSSGGQPVSGACPSTTAAANTVPPKSTKAVYGVATFNNYSSQKQASGVNCCKQSRKPPWSRSFIPPFSCPCLLHINVFPALSLSLDHKLTRTLSGAGGSYAAAAADLSPDLSPDPSGNACGQIPAPSQNTDCNSDGSPKDFKNPNAHPSCNRGNCGLCYKLTNMGGIPNNYTPGLQAGTQLAKQGTGIAIVQIIDACPSKSWQNTCKKFSFPGGAQAISPEQRCGAPNTNALDIDNSAYNSLVGKTKGSVSTPCYSLYRSCMLAIS